VWTESVLCPPNRRCPFPWLIDQPDAPIAARSWGSGTQEHPLGHILRAADGTAHLAARVAGTDTVPAAPSPCQNRTARMTLGLGPHCCSSRSGYTAEGFPSLGGTGQLVHVTARHGASWSRSPQRKGGGEVLGRDVPSHLPYKSEKSNAAGGWRETGRSIPQLGPGVRQPTLRRRRKRPCRKRPTRDDGATISWPGLALPRQSS
jgi:hypothetical protein